MSRIIYDYLPETKDLIERLICSGCTILHGSNDGVSNFLYNAMSLDAFLEELLGADEAWLTVRIPSGKEVCLYLVYGNEPGVLVCDYWSSYPGDYIEAVLDAHYTMWEGRDIPTRTVD